MWELRIGNMLEDRFTEQAVLLFRHSAISQQTTTFHCLLLLPNSLHVYSLLASLQYNDAQTAIKPINGQTRWKNYVYAEHCRTYLEELCNKIHRLEYVALICTHTHTHTHTHTNILCMEKANVTDSTSNLFI